MARSGQALLEYVADESTMIQHVMTQRLYSSKGEMSAENANEFVPNTSIHPSHTPCMSMQ